jgi:SAM-dependent methyltransferase
MLQTIKRYVPVPIRRILRSGIWDLEDRVTSIRGARGEFVPPRELMLLVSGTADRAQYIAMGNEVVQQIVTACNLQPHHRVLEVGCGCGRMAAPLTRILSPSGRYDGFDVVPDLVNWAQLHIGGRYPNFHFILADLYNQYYNPTGRYTAAEYHFPYEYQSYDVVFLTSVFTHMFIDDIAHYLAEIARVLKPGGKCLITWFLLNAESVDLLDQRSSEDGLLGRWPHVTGRSSSISATSPESAIAHDEQDVLALYTSYGLTTQPPIRYGSWCGRTTTPYQDEIVAIRD